MADQLLLNVLPHPDTVVGARPRHTYHVTTAAPNSNDIVVYTDGSCPGNGTRPDDHGGVGVYFEKKSGLNYNAYLRSNFNGQTMTNNRAELTALLAAVHIAGKYTSASNPVAHICTDSVYAYNSLTEWLIGWRQNGWRLYDGSPVLNQDLFKAILEKQREYYSDQGRQIVWEWTARTSPGIKEADLLAKGGAVQSFYRL